MDKNIEEESRDAILVLYNTKSDIAFVQVLMLNGMGVWDQARRMKEDPTYTSAKKRNCQCSPREKA